MKYTTLLLFSCLAVAGLYPRLAIADRPVDAAKAKAATEDYQRWDKDHNGIVSRDELPKNLLGGFATADTDRSGGISLAEHLDMLQRLQGKGGAKGTAKSAAKPLPTNIEVQRDIAYADTDNPRQKLDLYLPKQRAANAKPLPVIVWIHGGGWKAGDKSSGARQLAPFVATGDYVGVSVGYRLTDTAQWPAQINDCKAALRWIKGNAARLGLDAQHIGIWGSSAGGHLVSILGTAGDVPALEGTLGSNGKETSRVQCVVNFYGPENFVTMVTQESTIDRTVPGYPEALLIGGRVQDKPEAARDSSPVTYISKDDPPFLTAHGTRDPLVPFVQATELHAALKKVGVSSTLLTMEGGGHGFAAAELDATVERFFAKYLRGAESGEIADKTITVGK